MHEPVLPTPSHDRTDPEPLARWVAVDRVHEPQGDLTAVDFARLPFTPARIFTVSGCPVGTVRGRHAHKAGFQLLLSTRGRIRVDLRRGVERTVELRPDGDGLVIPAGVWAQQTYQTPDAVLLVLASHPYDPDGYVDVTVPPPGADDR